MVEWEGGLKVDSATSLPYSARKRGRVWRGGNISVISIELIERLIGYLEAEQGSLITRRCIDTSNGSLDLANPNSNRQLQALKEIDRTRVNMILQIKLLQRLKISSLLEQ